MGGTVAAPVDMAVAVDTGTARGEVADSAMVAGTTGITVVAATPDMVAVHTADMAVVDTEIAFTLVAATAVIAMAVDMDATSTLAAEVMGVTAMAAGTDMDTAAGATMAVAITDMITATGAVAATTAVPTGAARYSVLGSAMFDQGRFATTPMGTRYPVMCRPTARTDTEVVGWVRVERGRPCPFYSYRRASTGSIRVARRAGSQTAKRATEASRSGTAVKVTGSQDLTP